MLFVVNLASDFRYRVETTLPGPIGNGDSRHRNQTRFYAERTTLLFFRLIQMMRPNGRG